MRRDKPTGYGNHLLLVKARDNVPLHYFTGAGWNRSGQFADRATWEAYVRAFAAHGGQPAENQRECAAVNARGLVAAVRARAERERLRAEQVLW